VRSRRHTDKGHRAVALQRAVKAFRSWAAATVFRIDRIQDEVEAPRVGGHFVGVSARPPPHSHRAHARPAPSPAMWGDYMRAERMRQLHAHMAEAADAHDPDLLARPRLPMAKRRPGRDSRAEQRRHTGQIGLAVADPEDEMRIDDDGARIASKLFSPLPSANRYRSGGSREGLRNIVRALRRRRST
jgi:hypothetical protein